MKILVTGGSGYLGTWVRQFFSADDLSRRCFDHTRSTFFDILDEEGVVKVAEYDAVIHLAAHFDKSPDGASNCFRINAQGTANVIRNMKPGSVFVYASTKDVYGSHAAEKKKVDEHTSTDYCGQSAFEWSKLIGERYVEYYARNQNIRAAIFRLSTVYARPSDNEPGVITHYVESVKRHLPVRLPAGVDPVRDLLYVDDFSRACKAFIDSSVQFGLYNVGGGPLNTVSVRDLLKKVGAMIDIEPIIEEDPAMLPPVPLRYVSNIKRINDELGWQPQIGIDDGLRVVL